MWIEVKDVIGEELQGVKVRFATDYGVCEGLWQGRPPNASTRYEAEISIDDELVWGHTVLQTDKEEYSIYCDDQIYVLQGKLEHVFADGTSALHIGSSIILLEVTGDAPPVGSFIRVYTRSLNLYPSNI